MSLFCFLAISALFVLLTAYCSQLIFLYSRRLSYGRVSFGALVFHERAKKILASADHPLPCYAGRPDSIHIGFRRRTLHLHAFLKQLAVRLRGESHTFLPSEIVYAQ